MKLVIAEKPSLARAIAGELPGTMRREDSHIVVGDTNVVWCFGHLLELEEPKHYDERYAKWNLDDLPIVLDPAQWAVKPRVGRDASSTLRQLKLIQRLLKSASEVVHAGDADREGQMVVGEVLEYFGWKGKTTRLLVQDTTPEGVRKALAVARDNKHYAPLYAAAVARSRADWLVGMNLSRALGARAKRKGMSVGRVQTPTLALVVKRDREIEGFTSATFYVIEAAVDSDGGALTMLHDDPEQRITDKKKAEAIAGEIKGKKIALDLERKEQKENPPLPLMLATFQKAAESAYGWSASKSLKVVQELYEKQHATYPRTDCPYLPADHAAGAVALAKSIIQAGYCAEAKAAESVMAPSKLVYNDAKVAEHHALVPTKKIPPSNLEPQLLQGWKLIAEQYVKSLLPAYRAAVTTVSFDWQGRVFKARGEQGLNTAQSWRVLEPKKNAAPLALTRDPTQGIVMDAVAKKGETKPPKRYTEATLIEAMRSVAKLVDDPVLRAKLKETAGIGTAATQAATIEALKDKGFLASGKGKSIVSTPLGRFVVDACPQDLTNPGITALWEGSLDKIAEGQVPQDAFMRGINAYVAKHVGYFKTSTLPEAPAETASPTTGRGERKAPRKQGNGRRRAAGRWHRGDA